MQSSTSWHHKVLRRLRATVSRFNCVPIRKARAASNAKEVTSKLHDGTYNGMRAYIRLAECTSRHLAMYPMCRHRKQHSAEHSRASYHRAQAMHFPGGGASRRGPCPGWPPVTHQRQCLTLASGRLHRVIAHPTHCNVRCINTVYSIHTSARTAHPFPLLALCLARQRHRLASPSPLPRSFWHLHPRCRTNALATSSRQGFGQRRSTRCPRGSLSTRSTQSPMMIVRHRWRPTRQWTTTTKQCQLTMTQCQLTTPQTPCLPTQIATLNGCPATQRSGAHTPLLTQRIVPESTVH